MPDAPVLFEATPFVIVTEKLYLPVLISVHACEAQANSGPNITKIIANISPNHVSGQRMMQLFDAESMDATLCCLP